MELNLGKGARLEDDFYLNEGCPQVHSFGWYPLIRVNYWNGMKTKTGKKAWFVSLVIGWYARAYYGTAKADGTRTYAYWAGQLGGIPSLRNYVLNAWSTEHWSLRWRSVEPDCERWDNMGGI